MIRKLLFFSVWVLFLSGCRDAGEKEGGKTVFRYNEAAGITSLDPAFARDQANIWATHQIFNGLVQLGDNLEIRPCIASSWEISGDGCNYIFHLRSDIFFHDNAVFKKGKGRKVVARDFVYSFSRIADPKVASPGAWIFNFVSVKDGIFSFEAADDSTFSIRLKQSYPPFLGLLTTMYCSVVPEEAVNFYKQDFRKNPVGTGPFCFKMWKEGIKLVLTRNPGYFETENGKRLPYLDAVAISFLSDKQAAFLEFLKGRLDFMSGIDPSYKDELLTNDGNLNPKYTGKFRMVAQPYLNTEYLGFFVGNKNGSSENNIVTDKRIRQAINYSFDRIKMIRFLRNYIGTPGINGMIPKGMPGYDPAAVYYGYDPAKARKLLALAGFPGGKGLPDITLSTTSDYLDICKYIQFQAGEIGIPLKIDVTPPAALKEMKAQGKLPFFRASWIADYPDAENYLSLFYGKNFSPGGPNYTHYFNPAYDKLYERSMSCIDDSVRLQYYRQMENLMMEDSPVIVLYYDQVLRFIGNDVEGLGSDWMNILTLKKVSKKLPGSRIK
jgi:oligopeptide transport system substrate-binding protein